MIPVIAEIHTDCQTLLSRVLQDAKLTFFGEDGMGDYGRSTFPVTATVRSVNFDIESHADDLSSFTAFVYLLLDGYDAKQHGHAVTDRNLRISLDMLLSSYHVDPACLDWAPVEMQSDHTIVLTVDVPELLSW